jgi:hypothetical protein
MPMENFYSVRIIDPGYCSKYYAEARPGKAQPGHMQIDNCILKKYESTVSPSISKEEWRMFGTTQRYLLPVENVEPCKQRKEGHMIRTLCPSNDRGITEIEGIERRFGPIISMKKKSAEGREEFTVTRIPIGFSR